MATFSSTEIDRHVRELDGWTHEAEGLRKLFTFDSFPDAVAFLVRLAFDAEAADHHSDILVNYRRVTLTYTTHSEGGLTAKDFEGAKAADRHAAGRTS